MFSVERGCPALLRRNFHFWNALAGQFAHEMRATSRWSQLKKILASQLFKMAHFRGRHLSDGRQARFRRFSL
jgi:hypothetical protein